MSSIFEKNDEISRLTFRRVRFHRRSKESKRRTLIQFVSYDSCKKGDERLMATRQSSLIYPQRGQNCSWKIPFY